ncbi:MAG: hypothetical protein D6781_13625 [Verrucomicrobia bacterium]|nr:MAG: hypothetical protein D6781_13625 [Verrucomicrobiota bacterium]
MVSDKGPGTGDSAWDTRKIPSLLAGKAVEFIHRSAGENPFLLVYWSPTVHLPHMPPGTLDGKPIRETTPSRHLDMIRVLDWEVSRIVAALRETGEWGNTLFIFTSDNGGLTDGEAAKVGHYPGGGFRGSKNLPWEGGHRVPLIVTWPGVVKPGTRSDALVNGTDLVATIAELVGTRLTTQQAMDSWSFLPLLRGDDHFKPRQELLLQAGSRNELMFRQGPWKLIMQSDHKLTRFDPIALFNLDENPAEDEARNLIHDPAHAERVRAMRARYLAIRNSGERTAPLPHQRPGAVHP